jgi:hypothetical protein
MMFLPAFDRADVPFQGDRRSRARRRALENAYKNISKNHATIQPHSFMLPLLKLFAAWASHALNCAT